VSQRVKDIHRDLIISDLWTEPHSPWQNPAELNGVKYLKSHAQVLLYFTQLENTRTCIKGGDTRHIPYPDVLSV
jgi:hypothetical protein